MNEVSVNQLFLDNISLLIMLLYFTFASMFYLCLLHCAIYSVHFVKLVC